MEIGWLDESPPRAAVFDSPDRTFRYQYSWDLGSGGTVAFIMLNPSSATAARPDRTVIRVHGYAERWGFGRLVIVNLFAFCATDPRDMEPSADSVRQLNGRFLFGAATSSDLVVAAWGNHGGTRSKRVARKLRELGVDLHCLKVNATGQPAHPVRLPKALEPQSWAPVAVKGA